MTHDPLCPASKCDWGSLDSVCIGYENECGFVEHDCQCKLIAKVIKRERKKSKIRAVMAPEGDSAMSAPHARIDA